MRNRLDLPLVAQHFFRALGQKAPPERRALFDEVEKLIPPFIVYLLIKNVGNGSAKNDGVLPACLGFFFPNMRTRPCRW